MNSISLKLLALLVVILTSCIDEPDDPNAQINEEIKQIDARLQSLGLTDQVLYENTTGMRFIIQNYGEGIQPRNGQTVNVQYVGKLFSDGSTFASGTLNDKFENISPKGLRAALGIVLEGTTATVYVPSAGGYEDKGTTNVPPNSILIYEFTLADVEMTSAQQHQFQIDTAAISNYLETAGIADAVEHPSGIRYTISQQGSGQSPNIYNNVTFDYTLRSISSPQSVIQQSTVTNSPLFGLIDGMKIGLSRINVGTKATFYIPSGLAYGPSGQSGIPGNANLIFEVTLKEVVK